MTTDEKTTEVQGQVEDGLIEARRQMEFVGSGGDLGLTGLFNTFRIGTKWADTVPLEELELIETIDGESRSLDGNTVVLAMDQGDLVDMLDKHVGLNHGVMHLPQAADKRRELRVILNKAYGQRLTDGAKCVVVYMARFAGEG